VFEDNGQLYNLKDWGPYTTEYGIIAVTSRWLTTVSIADWDSLSLLWGWFNIHIYCKAVTLPILLLLPVFVSLRWLSQLSKCIAVRELRQLRFSIWPVRPWPHLRPPHWFPPRLRTAAAQNPSR